MDRLVLLAIADFCDDAGNSWPSMARIAQKACVTERGARQIVRRLEADGWLQTVVGGGRHGCNEYRILMRKPDRNPEPETRNDVPPEHGSPGTRKQKPGTRVQKTRNPRSAEPSRSIKDPSIKNTPTFSEPTKATPIGAEFEKVWSAYPRKVGKGAAEKAWTKARKRADFDDIAPGLRAFIRAAKGSDPKFIPHLSTWLNERRWEDDQSHAVNRPRTSTEDLEQLSTITSTEDLANLFPFPLRKALA